MGATPHFSPLLLLTLLVAWNLSEGQITESFSFTGSREIMLKNGQQQYESLLEKKSTPFFGQCWADAIKKLEQSCHLLDEYRQSWLAILFTSCFVKTIGRELNGQDCDDVIQWSPQDNKRFVDIIDKTKECGKTLMDSNVFNVYSLFYVHTQSICFYLQSEQWQKNTESLVNNLVHSAHVVSDDLNTAVNTIRVLEELQGHSLQAQLSINSELSEAKQNLEKFQQHTKEQRDLIEKIILQFKLFQEFLLNEFSTNSTIVFYMVTLLVIYLMTTLHRTIGVRLLLYLMLAAGLVIEKNMLVYFVRLDSWLRAHVYSSDPLCDDIFADLRQSQGIWFFRRSMLILLACTYLWWLITYQDISQVSFRLLKEHTEMLRHIQHQINLSKDDLNLIKDYSSDCESNSSELSYSNYDSEDDSFISTDYESDSENIYEPRRYNLRDTSNLKSKLSKLPHEYQGESVTDFVQNVHSSLRKNPYQIRKNQFNYYSSDEN